MRSLRAGVRRSPRPLGNVAIPAPGGSRSNGASRSRVTPREPGRQVMSLAPTAPVKVGRLVELVEPSELAGQHVMLAGAAPRRVEHAPRPSVARLEEGTELADVPAVGRGGADARRGRVAEHQRPRPGTGGGVEGRRKCWSEATHERAANEVDGPNLPSMPRPLRPRDDGLRAELLAMAERPAGPRNADRALGVLDDHEGWQG